jgi:hypothetical protein
VRRRTLANRVRDDRIGEVEFFYEVVNQDGLVAMTQRCLMGLERRRQAGGG